MNELRLSAVSLALSHLLYIRQVHTMNSVPSLVACIVIADCASERPPPNTHTHTISVRSRRIVLLCGWLESSCIANHTSSASAPLSARGAGENNLHMGGLMDTFMDSSEWREDECEAERDREWGAVIGWGQCRAWDLVKQTPQIALYRITSNRMGHKLMSAIVPCHC